MEWKINSLPFSSPSTQHANGDVQCTPSDMETEKSKKKNQAIADLIFLFSPMRKMPSHTQLLSSLSFLFISFGIFPSPKKKKKVQQKGKKNSSSSARAVQPSVGKRKKRQRNDCSSHKESAYVLCFCKTKTYLNSIFLFLRVHQQCVMRLRGQR